MNQNGETFVRGQTPRAVTLTMRQGPGAGQRFVVSREHVSIGRSPDNDVSIADQQISRHHATITWETNQFVMRDLQSANGTTVNGTTLVGPCPLRDGDVIGFGDIMLTFQGTTGMTDHGGSETYMRPSPVSAAPHAAPAHSGTIAMPQQSGGKSALPIILGVGAALVIGLAIVAGLFFFFTTKSQSQTGPKISIQQPASGAQVTLGQPVDVLALIKDPKGVTRVELWVDNKLEDTTASNVAGGQEEMLVQQSWIPTSGGAHTISLQAFNADGEMSQPMDVMVNVVGSETGGTPASTAASATGTPEQPVACTNNAAFVADVTVPDNSVFPPGGRIDKIWRLRNTGTCPWQTGYQLIFVSGDKMGAPDGQAVVPTASNGTTDVTVTMYAPSAPGVYKGVWRMVTNTGQQFGQNITILIQVPYPDTPTATITPTSPAPPAPIVQVSADSTNITAGQCTIIRASVQNVTAAWLDGEPIVGNYKEKEVCPCNDTTYNVEAVPPSGPHIFQNVTVHVTGTCAASKPDLVVKELKADNVTPLKGNAINLQMRIKNEGSTPATNFAAAWRPFGPGTSTWIIVGDSLSLNPGEGKWVNWSYTYTDAGTYESKGVADYLNNIDENNEGNNHQNLTIEVKSLLLPGPGILTAIAPGPMLPINPGLLTAIAPGP